MDYRGPRKPTMRIQKRADTFYTVELFEDAENSWRVVGKFDDVLSAVEFLESKRETLSKLKRQARLERLQHFKTS